MGQNFLENLQKVRNSTRVDEIGGAGWSSGEQSNAESGNHQTCGSLTLTLRSAHGFYCRKPVRGFSRQHGRVMEMRAVPY